MKTFLIILAISISDYAFGQENTDREDTAYLYHKLKDFIPLGYQLLSKTVGNLNHDSIPDIILVLKKFGEDTAFHPAPKRPLLIFLGDTEGKYVLSVKNEMLF